MGTGTIHLAVTSKWRWKGVDLGKQDKAQTCVKKTLVVSNAVRRCLLMWSWKILRISFLAMSVNPVATSL